MTKEQIFENIDAIVEETHCPESNIELETKFVEDLGMDSLDRADLVLNLEKEFNIEISDDQAEKIESVGDAVDLIHKTLQQNVLS